MFSFTIAVKNRFEHSARESIIGTLAWNDTILSQEVISDIGDSLRELYLSTDAVVRTYLTQREIIKYLLANLDVLRKREYNSHQNKANKNKLHQLLSELDSYAQDKQHNYLKSMAQYAVRAFDDLISKKIAVVFPSDKWNNRTDIFVNHHGVISFPYVVFSAHSSVIAYQENKTKPVSTKTQLSLSDVLAKADMSVSDFFYGVRVVGLVVSDGKTETILSRPARKMKVTDMAGVTVSDESAMTGMLNQLKASKEAQLQLQKEEEMRQLEALRTAKIRSEIEQLANKFGISVEELKKTL